MPRRSSAGSPSLYSFQAFVLALVLMPFEYPAWLGELLKRLGGTLIPLAPFRLATSSAIAGAWKASPANHMNSASGDMLGVAPERNLGGFARVCSCDEEHAMPRYYFYLREDAGPPNITGAVFQDAAAAKEFAKRLRTALTDRAACAKAHWSVAVTDENGSAVFEFWGGKAARRENTH
jgi:hypothetical protein